MMPGVTIHTLDSHFPWYSRMKSRPSTNIWNSLAGEVREPLFTGGVTRTYSMGGYQTPSTGQRKVVAPRRASPNDFVDALGHGITLLECWCAGDTWLSNADLADRSGLTKSMVSRLATVLVDLGYLYRDKPRGSLRLTGKTLELGFGSIFASEPVDMIRPELERLARDLDVYVLLGVRRADKVQVVDNVVSPSHPNAVEMYVGGLLPMCRSASGFAVLSALPEEQVAPLIERLRSRYGPRWQSLQPQLDRTKQEYSSKGYCTAVACLSRTVASLAIPVVPRSGENVFVVGCGMPTTAFYRERVDGIVPHLLQVADRLHAVLDN